MMQKLITILSISVLFFSCNKQKSIKGTVKDYGAPELDGCGWVIDVNGEIFKPTNLDAEYKVHELDIKFDYKDLKSTVGCGINPNAFKQIELLKVY